MIDRAPPFAFRVGLFYAALFLIYGVHLPYLPVWLDWKGLSATEIGIITAVPYFARLAVTPAFAMAADRTANHRQFIVALAWTSLGAVLLLSQMQGFWPVLGAALVFALAITTIMPLTETVAMSGVRSAGLDYGRMRLWGSATFIVASFAGGALVDRTGAWIAVWMMVAGSVATVVAAHLLPRPVQVRIAPDTPPVLRFAIVHKLVTSRVFILFLVAAGAVQAAHATFYTFGALHWRGQGISAAWVGVLWAIGIAVEIAVFAYSAAIVRRFGTINLLIAGAAAAVVRWTAMSLDPPLAMLVPLQILHGLTYGAAHLGAIHFIARAVPDEAAGTAQALYATITAGVAMGAATLVAGALYQVAGSWTYLAMALLALLGFAASVAIHSLWTGTALWSGGFSGASSPFSPKAEAPVD